MSKKRFINSIGVGKTCSEDWAQMSGNEQVRFCSHCSKNVNNISEMTAKQARRLVNASNGDLCIRYVVNPVTRRPMFAEQLLQITRRTPGLAAGVMTASIALSSQTLAQQSEPTAPPVVVTAPTPPPVTTNEDPPNVPIEPRVITELPIDGPRMLMGVVAMSVTRTVNNPLTVAVQNEDIDEVRRLIASGAKVNGKEEDKRTPIFYATENGNVEILRLLLDFGAKVNIRDENKQTPLMQIDDDASVELVNLLIRHGAKLDLTDDEGNSALIIAAEETSAEVVKALVDAGADVNLANKEGATALINAAEKEDIESVRALLLAGAKVNARDEDGENAWDHTANEEIEALLVSFGSEVTTPEPELELVSPPPFENK